MLFTKSVTDIIRQRHSVRTYVQRMFEPQTEARMKAFLTENFVGPFKTPIRFEFITAKHGDTEEIKKLSTYGQIKNPAGFLFGAMGPGAKNLEDYGYVMEKFVLHATDLDLGTCWISGSFHGSGFAQAIKVQSHEAVPAAVVVGYPADTPAFRERLLRMIANTVYRIPWEYLFFKGNFNTPLSQVEAKTYATPLMMIRLAPSASNRQPWRIVKDATQNIFHFYMQRAPYAEQHKRKQNLNLKNMLTSMVEALITILKPKKVRFSLKEWQHCDMGIAMCHFEYACKELNLKGNWKIDDPGISQLPPKTEYIVSWLAF